MADENTSYYVVMVEWDGAKPPMTWYNRLHSWGYRVRGDKSISPVRRRATPEYVVSKGVIFQEGAVITQSHSFAEHVAKTARAMGAKGVMLGVMMVEKYHLDKMDTAAIGNLGVKLKRGPKAHADAGVYTLTCLEEGKTQEYDFLEPPHLCPGCSGTMFTYRKGGRGAIRIPENVSIFDAWWATRFYTGVYEVPKVADDGVLPPKVPASVRIETTTIQGVLKDNEDKITFSEGLRLLDAAYCATLRSKTGRIHARMKALENFYRKGGSTIYSLGGGDMIDIVDVASVNREFERLL